MPVRHVLLSLWVSVLLTLVGATAHSQTVQSITVSATSVVGGANLTGTITLSSANRFGDLSFALTSSGPSTVSPFVIVPQGSISATFTISTNIVTANMAASVSSGTVFSPSFTVTPGYTQSLPVTANAYVQAGANAGTNLSPFNTLLIETDNAIPDATDLISYLQLDLSSVTVAPTSAIFKVTVQSIANSPSTGLGMQCSVVPNTLSTSNTTAWTERNITWNNAPGLSGTPGAQTPPSSGVVQGTATVYPITQIQVLTFDLTNLVAANMGQKITLQLSTTGVQAGNSQQQYSTAQAGFYGRSASSYTPALVMVYPGVLTNNNPAPPWAGSILPTDSMGVGDFGASSADCVDLSSGAEENHPGPDIIVRNPIGPDVTYERMYRSCLALQGYGSPGLPAGWVDNYDITIAVQPGGNTWNNVMLRYPNGASEVLTPAPGGSGMLAGPKGWPYVASGVQTGTVNVWTSFTVMDENHSTLTFAPRSGNVFQLVGITDMLGHGIAISRNLDGSIQHINNPTGPLLMFSGSTAGSSSVTDWTTSGRTVTYQYINGFLTHVSQIGDPYVIPADRWTYAYGGIYAPAVAAQLLSVTFVPFVDMSGGGQTFAYDKIAYTVDGHVDHITDANKNTHSYLYFAKQTQVVAKDNKNNVTQDWYQSFLSNKDAGTTDANNQSTQIAYNDANNVFRPTQVINALNQTVSMAYNFGFGHLTATNAPTSTGGTLTSQITYDSTLYANGLPSSLTVGNKTATTISYYPQGNTGLNWAGLPYQVTGPKPGSPGSTVSTIYKTYSNLGNILTVQIPGPNNYNVTYTFNYTNDSVPGDTVTNGVEALGEPLSVTSPLGHVTHYRYDSRGNIIRMYDANGFKTVYTYNSANQCTQITYPPSDIKHSASYTVYEYWYPGGPLETVSFYDESGSNTAYRKVIYGENGEDVLAQATGSLPTTTMAYDALYRPNQIADGNKNSTAYNYDAVGNPVLTTFPNHVYVKSPSGPKTWDTIQSTFDTTHSLATMTIGRGGNPDPVVTFGRANSANQDNSVLSVTYSDGSPNVTYQYDMYGRVIQAANGTATLAYTYDDLDNVLEEDTTFVLDTKPPTLSPKLAVIYTYNNDGSRASMQTPIGLYTYAYDDDGRLTSVTFPWAQTVSYTYDAGGRLTQQSSSLVTTLYNYDHRDFLVGLQNQDSNRKLLSLFGSLTPIDLKPKQGDPLNWIVRTGTGDILTIPVVTIPQIVSANGFAPDASGSIQYLYDDLDFRDRLVSESRAFTSYQGIGYYRQLYNVFGYDPADNLTTLRVVNSTQTFNSDNQVATVPGYYYFNGDGTANITQLAFWDPTQKRLDFFLSPLRYESSDRLNWVSIPDGFGSNVTMGYRPDGLRAWKRTYLPRYYLYDGTTVVCELTADSSGNVTPAVGYGYGANGLVQSADSQGNYIHYTFDPQGNLVTRCISNNGACVGQNIAIFDSFGLRVADYRNDLSIEPTAGVVGFGGQWGYYTDVETNLILCGYRFYNPVYGTFITRDPIGYDGGINLYAFCGNNPVNNIDPTGLDDLDNVDKSLLGCSTLFGMLGGGATAGGGGALATGGILAVPAAVAGAAQGAAVGAAVGGCLVIAKHKLVDFMARRSSSSSGQLTLPNMPPPPARSAASLRVSANQTNSANAVRSLQQSLGGQSEGFLTSKGMRIVDLYENFIAHEVKVGRTSLSSFIRNQIAKDAELLNGNARITGVTWDFYRSPVTNKIGPTDELEKALRRVGITIVYH